MDVKVIELSLDSLPRAEIKFTRRLTGSSFRVPRHFFTGRKINTAMLKSAGEQMAEIVGLLDTENNEPLDNGTTL